MPSVGAEGPSFLLPADPHPQHLIPTQLLSGLILSEVFACSQGTLDLEHDGMARASAVTTLLPAPDMGLVWTSGPPKPLGKEDAASSQRDQFLNHQGEARHIKASKKEPGLHL